MRWGLLGRGGGVRVGAQTRAGLADPPGEPHLGTHTSVFLGWGGSRPGKERRRAPLVCSWMLSRCGQGRVFILQMWEASGAWELYSARRWLASWVWFPSLGGGVGGSCGDGDGGGGTAISWVSLLPPLQSLRWILGSDPRPHLVLEADVFTDPEGDVGGGGGDQVLTPTPPTPRVGGTTRRFRRRLMSGVQNENKMWWREAVCPQSQSRDPFSGSPVLRVLPFSPILY